MRKALTSSLLFLLLLPCLSYAMNINGATTQGKGKFSIGIDSEYVFNRETNKGKDFFIGGPVGTLTSKLSITSANQTLLKLSYGILSGLDIYVRAGVVTPTFYRRQEVPIGPIGLNAKLKGDTSLIYGGGLKGALKLPLDFLVGCDLQYLRYASDYSGQVAPFGIGFPLTTKGKITYEEWQAAPYFAKEINLKSFGALTPYLGAKYSHMNLEDKETQSGMEGFAGNALTLPAGYVSRNKVGAFCGLSYLYKDSFFLNFEGAFVDETSASMSLGYKF